MKRFSKKWQEWAWGYEWTQCWLQEPFEFFSGMWRVTGVCVQKSPFHPGLLSPKRASVRCVCGRATILFPVVYKEVPLRLSMFPDNTVKVCGYHDFSISIFPSIKEPMLQSRRPRLWVKWSLLVSNRTCDLNSFARLQSSHKEKKQQWKTHS